MAQLQHAAPAPQVHHSVLAEVLFFKPLFEAATPVETSLGVLTHGFLLFGGDLRIFGNAFLNLKGDHYCSYILSFCTAVRGGE